MNDIAIALLVMLLQATLALSFAAAVVGLVLRFSRAVSPSVHRVGWIVVLLQGWLFVGLPLAIPWYEPPAVVESRVSAISPEWTPSPIVPGLGPRLDRDFEGMAPGSPAAAIDALEKTPAPSRWRLDWATGLVAFWAVGIVTCVGVAILRYVRFARSLPDELSPEQSWLDEWRQLLNEQSIVRNIPLQVTRADGPMLCRLPSGYRLIVPIDFWRSISRDARLAILRHELTHYRRRDLWKSLLVWFLALPHWFNPLSWWAVRRFEECGEWACDAQTVNENIQGTTAYAKALLHLGTVDALPSYQFGSARRGALATRIRRLLRHDRTKDSTMKKTIVIACLLALGVVGAIRWQLVARVPERDEPAPSSNEAEPPKGTPLSEQMVEVAREGYLATSAAYNAMTITTDILIQSSQLLLKAEQRVAESKQDQIAALSDYRDRMKDLKDKIEALYKVGARGGEAEAYYLAKYYYLEAEYLLEQAKK